MKAWKPLRKRSRKSLIIALILVAIEVVGASQFAQASGRITNISNVTANTILHGKGAPAISLGKSGDFYIDLISMNMYGPKTKSGWSSPTPLKGPAGTPGASITTSGKGAAPSSIVATKGAKGDKGEKGDAGVAGPAGVKGEKGDKGEAGAVGPAGAPGSPGAPGGGGGGSTGPAGPVGAQGPQGPQGIPGEKGETGSVGLQGIQGAKGETGTATTSAKYGDITFASPISAPYSYIESNSFGNFPNKYYVVDVFVYSTLSDGAAPNLGVAFTASGGLIIIQSNYLVGTGNSFRTGTAKVETSAICRLLVTVESNINPKLVLRASSSNASSGNPQTLSGYFIVEDVGAVS